MPSVTLTVNGGKRDFSAPLTVARLLEAEDCHPEQVVVELNMEILSRRAYSDHILKSGDVVEILAFMGGG